MGSTFLEGTKRGLLKAVGAAYGYIVVEDENDLMKARVITMSQARVVLIHAVKVDLMTTDEAGDMEKTIAAAGLAENFSTMFAKAAAVKIEPSGERKTFFMVCTQPGCNTPIPHGTLENADGEILYPKSMTDSGKGFLTLDRLVCEGTVSVNDAILCFKEMRDAKLAEDEAALTRDSSDKSGNQRVGGVTVIDMMATGGVGGIRQMLEQLMRSGGVGGQR